MSASGVLVDPWSAERYLPTREGKRMEVIGYAYHHIGSCAPYRALRITTHARDTRAVLRRVARRVFGDGVTLAAGPCRDVKDSAGRNIYGPAGNEVLPDGTHYQVWRDGSIAGYVSTYARGES